MTPINELWAEKIAEAIFLLVFRIAFPETLLSIPPGSGFSEMAQTTHRHCDLETESAQWADSVKIRSLFYQWCNILSLHILLSCFLFVVCLFCIIPFRRENICVKNQKSLLESDILYPNIETRVKQIGVVNNIHGNWQLPFIVILQ